MRHLCKKKILENNKFIEGIYLSAYPSSILCVNMQRVIDSTIKLTLWVILSYNIAWAYYERGIMSKKDLFKQYPPYFEGIYNKQVIISINYKDNYNGKLFYYKVFGIASNIEDAENDLFKKVSLVDTIMYLNGTLNKIDRLNHFEKKEISNIDIKILNNPADEIFVLSLEIENLRVLSSSEELQTAYNELFAKAVMYL